MLATLTPVVPVGAYTTVLVAVEKVPATTNGVPLPVRVIVLEEPLKFPAAIFRTEETVKSFDNVHPPPIPLKMRS